MWKYWQTFNTEWKFRAMKHLSCCKTVWQKAQIHSSMQWEKVFVKCAVHLVISAHIYLHMWLKWCVYVCVRSLHTVWSSFLQESKSKTGRLQIRREKDSEPASDLHTPSHSFYSLHPSIILSPQIFPNPQYAILESSFLFSIHVLLSLMIKIPVMYLSI